MKQLRSPVGPGRDASKVTPSAPPNIPNGVEVPYTSSLARMLVETGVVSAEQASKALDSARREKLPLNRVLVRDGLVHSTDLAALTALHLSLPMVDLRNQTIEPAAVTSLPEEMARRFVALPIRQTQGRLIVAMADPTDLQLVQDLTARTNMTIDPVVATMEDILDHIDVSYRLIDNPTESSSATFRESDAATGRITAGVLRSAPPAQVIDLLLRQALQDRASDIHIAPSESRLRVRFRIDGILHDVLNLPMEMHPTLLSRLKIVSGMNIAERRRPQDGQFTADVPGRKVDVRVAVSSTASGEMAVLRLLDKKFTLLGLEQIGMSSHALESFRRLLKLPYGMIIVCGPTGAGKSTTLYGSILQMNRVEQHVISLEDPVEYQIPDANQMQIRPEAGITFATQLRSILRLDPDVILVGEIRDQETAVIATQAALTGHLVLTSLHANDAVSALLRLRDLGVAPYLTVSSVAGIVAQRMVRVVCSGCRSPMTRPVSEQKAYSAETGENLTQFIYGSGCNTCAHTGYRGRTGVFEVLSMTDSVRRLFLAEAPHHTIWAEGRQEGMVPLRRDGMLKVQQGITTPYEVMRVLFSLD